jgi:DNA polymerase III delta prime subunit
VKNKGRKTNPSKKARLSDEEDFVENDDSRLVEEAPTLEAENKGAEITTTMDVLTTAVSHNHGNAVMSHLLAVDAVDESKKVLKLNGHGGFGTPQHVKQIEIPGASFQEKPKRTRKRKGLILLKYGRSTLSERMMIGKKINHILSQPPNPTIIHITESIEEDMVTQKPAARKKRTKAANPTHPFFNGNGKKNGATTPPPKIGPIATVNPSPRSFKSFTTPGKMKLQAQMSQQAATSETTTRTLPPISRIFSLPGTHHSLWPPRGFAHVRGSDVPLAPVSCRPPVRRKQKNVLTSVLDPFLQGSSSSQLSDAQDDLAEARVDCPDRLLVSGKDLQINIRSRIKAANLEHPAIAKLFTKLPETLTPFDRGAFETQSWTSKYAPQSAVEILQAGQEAVALKDWLANQTTASAPAQGRSVAEEKARTKRKRKRKEAGLDSFIVDSDDDVEMQTLDRGQETPELQGELGSMIRGADPARPPANAVLLCGTYGVGKTAAVYAVAKELGFDVFEISSNSRRSGRDIIDKVGDMSLNHQVRRGERASTVGSLDDNASDTGLDFSLPTEPDEQQRSLTSFFGAVTKAVKKDKKPTKKQEAQIQELTKLRDKASKQKQSLILIEEADVLFDEDKQFWETIITLATQSKRPIVLTCNDESLIPQEELCLHAILRFRPPPKELVVDYLIVLAALEGHLLQVNAVSSLYKTRRQDLRGTIKDLQLWCQMAVGDSRGGVDWYLQRWPKGIDQDAHGHTLRTISQNTYRVILNLSDSPSTGTLDAEDELLNAWRDHDVDPIELAWVELSKNVKWRSPSTSASERIPVKLKEYEQCADLFSAVDISTTLDLPSLPGIHDSLDLTLPDITAKAALDYISGYKLLRRARPAVDYQQFDAQLMSYFAFAIPQYMDIEEYVFSGHHRPPLVDTGASRRHNTWASPCLSNAIINPSSWCSSSVSLPKHTFTTTRAKLNTALEPLLHPSTITSSSAPPSYADRDFPGSVLDTAPYVRSIISYDLALERQRDQLSSITTLGGSQASSGSISGGEGSGKAAKRARTTRASRSALEGGARASTRRERWFAGMKREEDMDRVVNTGGKGWSG